mgnify:CR=1 FL=1
MAAAAGLSLRSWQDHAEELSGWVSSTLLNRADRYAVCPPPGSPDEFPEPRAVDEALTSRVLGRHFAGSPRYPRVALADRSPDDDARWLAVTLRRSAEGDAAATPGLNFNLALHWADRLSALGFDPLLEDADGQGSFRLFVLFDSPAPVARVAAFGEQVTVDYADQGLTQPPRLSPAVGSDVGFLRLPGPHPSLTHASSLWDFDGERWLEPEETIAALLRAKATPPTFLRTPRPARVAARASPQAGPCPQGPDRPTVTTAAPPRPAPSTPPREPHAMATPTTALPVAVVQPPPAAPPAPPATAATLPPAAVELVTAIAARTGMRDDEVVRRVFAWVAAQDELLQALVLGQIPTVLRPAAAKALAEKIAAA